MIWKDKISKIVELINAQSVYNTSRTTTPSNLGLEVYNQAQDHILMHTLWRDLMVVTQLDIDSNNQITMPSDFGRCISVYTDSSNVGKPDWYYYLDHPDISKRYTETVDWDSDTGVRTFKFTFPSSSGISSSPYVVYQKVLDDATQAEIDEDTKYSFFPKGIMLVAAKLILQDYYGVAANQDPNWILKRFDDEMKDLSQYATYNNAPLDFIVHDGSGEPTYINGMKLDGSNPQYNIRTPYTNSTLFTGGV